MAKITSDAKIISSPVSSAVMRRCAIGVRIVTESFTLAIFAINLAATVTPLRGLVGRDENDADAQFLTPTSEPVDSPGQ